MKVFPFLTLLLPATISAYQVCHNPVDIALVVEDTAYLPSEYVTTLKTFLSQIVNYYPLGKDNAQVAFQLFNDQSTTIFDLNTYSATADAKSMILRTKFQRRSTNPGDAAAALSYTWNNVLTPGHGERSCYPAVVILVSFSSPADPNGFQPSSEESKALHFARQLINAGALVITVGVGPYRNSLLLMDLAGNQNNYYDFEDFSDLDENAAVEIATQACQYTPSGVFYPCEMQTVKADLTFIVDVSGRFNDSDDATMITSFMQNFLSPYTYGKNGVQAALITYSRTADLAVPLSRARNLDSFMRQVVAAFAGAGGDDDRYIYNALELAQYHVLNTARPDALHKIYIFTSACFNGPDPVPIANSIRIGSAEIFVIPTSQNFGLWKEFVGIAGKAENFYEVQSAPHALLSGYLHHQAWRNLCDGVIPPVHSTTTSTLIPTTSTTPTTTSTTTKPTTTTSTTTSTTTTTTTRPTTTMSTTTITSTTTPTTTTTTTRPTTTTSTTPPTTTTTTPTITLTTTTPTTTSTTTTRPTTTTTTSTTTPTTTTSSTSTTSTTTTTTPSTTSSSTTTTPTTTPSTTTTTTPSTTSSTSTTPPFPTSTTPTTTTTTTTIPSTTTT